MEKQKGKKKRSIKKSLETKSKLLNLVDKLLLKCTVNYNNWKEEWSLFKEIYEITQEIINLEKENCPNFPEREKNIEPFLFWCVENNATVNGVTIKEVLGKHLGVVVEEPLKNNELVFCIPRKLMLTTEQASKSKLKSVILKDRMLSQMPNVVLSLYLMLEFIEEGSFWKPYIDVLPSSFSTVLYFTLADFEEFQTSPILAGAVNLYRCISRQYAYFFKLFQTEDQLSKLDLKHKFTFEFYRWAVSCVMTRQNNIPSSKGPQDTTLALVPLWDMCNHENSEYSTGFNIENDTLECRPTKDYQKGDEFHIFYGARTNAETMINSGFVQEENPYDFYLLKLGISRSDPLLLLKTELCSLLGIPLTSSYKLRPLASQAETPFDHSLLKFCTVFVMDKDQVHNWLFDKDQLNFQDRFDNDLGLQKKALLFLSTRLTLLLNVYKTTVEEDKTILQKALENGLPRQMVMPLLLRLSEKLILERSINFVTQLNVLATTGQNGDFNISHLSLS